jgi:putative ABC transport system substrate-binding protein
MQLQESFCDPATTDRVAEALLVLAVGRRDFLWMLAATLAEHPGRARVQPPDLPTIGFLSTRSRDESKELTAAFLAGLKAEGFAHEDNVAIKYRWAEIEYDRLPSLGSELIGERVSVIAAVGGIHSGLAAKQLTSEMPIVFVSAGDPVALKLVSSLNRPNENVTGISMITVALAPKRLELLNEVVPELAAIAFLANPRSPYFRQERGDVVAAAAKLRRALSVFTAASTAEIEASFDSFSRRGVVGLLVSGDPFFDGERNCLVSLAARYSLPAIYQWREFATIGGLVSYGTSILDAYTQAGVYAGKILNGAKVGDLPVLQPTRIETAINLKTAAALGLNVPTLILARADEVIE